ncbi:MAG: ABC transporter ATP-binding protein [Phycisphaerales bacterium]|nr:ABC transporter ATP-binding protein [Phycisphaerales bacterium]
MTLVADAITVRFGSIKAIDGVDLEISPGSLTVVLGPNAAGKSTLVRGLAGVQPVQQGLIRLDDRDLAALSDVQRASRIGYLPQRASVTGPFSVRDVVSFGRYASRGSQIGHLNVGTAVDRVGLGAEIDRPLADLSIGQQQRVGLARTLVQIDPTERGILLLDEPFSAQDPHEIERMAAILGEFVRAGGTVVAALHDVSVAWSIADRAVLLAQGRVIHHGEAEATLSPAHLGSLYGTPFVSSSHGPVPASRSR